VITTAIYCHKITFLCACASGSYEANFKTKIALPRSLHQTLMTIGVREGILLGGGAEKIFPENNNLP